MVRAINDFKRLIPLPPPIPCSVSKQQAIVPGQCYELEDGTSSFKEFHGSRNNRFTSPEQAAKNRIQHPSNVLHFFNAQPEATPEIFSQVWILGLHVHSSSYKLWLSQVLHLQTLTMFVFLQICDEIGVKAPVNVKMFTGKSTLLYTRLLLFELCQWALRRLADAPDKNLKRWLNLNKI